jgi:hypothetical protein
MGGHVGIGELTWDECGTITNSNRSSENEPIAAAEWSGGDNADTRHCNGSEQECSHATKDGAGNSDQRCGEFGKDAHDQEPEATEIASLAIRASGERNNTVILCEGGHGCDGAKPSKNSIQAISQDTTLDARVKELAINLET